ncbi:MAG: hypothetical protein IJC62_05380, partial [Clostridia bacterium]|nr:hypothetical protein [Clostridia bacterium]
INVGGEPTYIMVLKDDNGHVRLYAMVNVRNYNVVVTSESQDDAFQKYKAALALSGNYVDSSTLVTDDIVVNDILFVTQNGETVVYIKSPSGVYRMQFHESILFVEPGDTIRVAYTSKNEGGVTVVTKIELKK